MAKITAVVRRQWIGVLRERYRDGTRVEKLRILDERVSLSEYHRKYAITVLNGPGDFVAIRAGVPLKRGRPSLYDDAGSH